MGVIAGQHVLALVYGYIKTGKTTDTLMSFPRGLFIAAPGALKPSIGVAGFEPPAASIWDAPGLIEMTERVKATAPGTYDAIVIDDLTLYIDREVAALQRSGVGGYDLWGAIFTRMLRLREAARQSRMHTILNCHAKPPRTEDGVKLPGCPALPGKTLPYSVPAAADIVVRTEPFPPAMGSGIGFPILYRCDATDPEWRTGDRHNVIPDMSPINLGEIMRLIAIESGAPAGWAPRRAPGMDWIEPLVAIGAKAILAKGLDITESKRILHALIEAALTKSSDERHALWAARDAWDRAVLRNALSSHRRKYFAF